MYCSRCGNKLDDNIKYCPKCGTKILERPTNSKKFKPSPVMIIVIAINIILLLLNIWFSISSIGMKDYIVSSLNSNKSITISINEMRLDRAIDSLAERGIEVLDDILVIHENYKVKQYLLVTRFSSERQNYVKKATGYKGSGFYYVYSLDTKTWQLNEIQSASMLEGKDSVINEAINNNKLAGEQIGKFTYNQDNKTNKPTTSRTNETSSQDYVIIALTIIVIVAIIYWCYKKTKRISTIISIIGMILIIVQLLFILPNIHFGRKDYSNDTSDSSSSTSSITGIEQAIKEGKLKESYMKEGITEGKLKVEYYEGELEKYYKTFEECLADAKKLNIVVDSSKFSNLTGIERAIKDGAIGDDYMANGVTEDQLLAALDGNLGMYYSDNPEQCIEDARKLNILKETGGSIVVGKTYKYSDNSCEMTITIIDDKRVKLDYTSYTDTDEPKTDMDGHVYPYEATYIVNKGSLQIKEPDGQSSYYINENGTLETFGMILK